MGANSMYAFDSNLQYTYFEIASLSSYRNYKGKIVVNYSLSFTRSSARPEAGKNVGNDSAPFGSRDLAHGITNFEDTGANVTYLSSANSRVVLERSCSDVEFANLKGFIRSGAWGKGLLKDRLGIGGLPRSQGGDIDAPGSNEYPLPDPD